MADRRSGTWLTHRARGPAVEELRHTLAGGVAHGAADDGVWDVVFAAQRIARVDLRDRLGHAQPVSHVPERVSPVSPV